MKNNLKKTAAVLTALVMLIICALPAVSLAYEGDFNTGIYRINDFVGIMDQNDIDVLDDHVYELVAECGIDMPVAIIDQETLDHKYSGDYMEWYFDHNDYGYGPERSGFMLLIVDDIHKVKYKAFGPADKAISEKDKRALAGQVEKTYQTAGIYAALTAYYDGLEAACMGQEEAGGQPAPDTQTETQSDLQPQEARPDKPEWYPADVDAFTDFHNENAPRVVDNADIFTDEEEAQMTQKAQAIVDKYGRDLVIFTDVSSYGLSRGVYAADFYQFNGYGLGDDYSGSVLFICMEEGNRGWWSAARGAAREYFTEKNINWLDDRLEPYMIDGNYGEGVLSYIDDLECFYRLPDWIPEDPSAFVRFHADNPKVVDNMGVLTADEISILEEKARSICDTYDTDVLIFLDRIMSLDASETGRTYALYKGYGAGDDYECSVFAVNRGLEYSWSCLLEGSREYVSEKSMDRLKQWVNDPMYDKEYFEACSIYLDKLEKMYKKGHVPKKLALVFPAVVSLLIGLISAKISTSVLTKRMSNIMAAYNASGYVIPGSFRLNGSRDDFINSHRTYTRKPEPDDSGPSGGSSYSSSYSSSGGASFSGGGRSF